MYFECETNAILQRGVIFLSERAIDYTNTTYLIERSMGSKFPNLNNIRFNVPSNTENRIYDVAIDVIAASISKVREDPNTEANNQ
jgi:hypothetical protein